jgi:hypothetical protein
MISHKRHSIRNGRLARKGIEPPTDWNDLTQVKRVIKAECGADCNAAIYEGVEVGGKHYSLTGYDQTEMLVQLQAIKEGATGVPYHADGELCRIFTAVEFEEVAAAAARHIFYHRTYCNHLNAWIKRAGIKEIESIKYGAELPQDLKESMEALIQAAAGETE